MRKNYVKRRETKGRSQKMLGLETPKKAFKSRSFRNRKIIYFCLLNFKTVFSKLEKNIKMN